jgi:hypothetical protein
MVESFRQFATGALPRALTSVASVEVRLGGVGPTFLRPNPTRRPVVERVDQVVETFSSEGISEPPHDQVDVVFAQVRVTVFSIMRIRT